jgi:hypothetical protein
MKEATLGCLGIPFTEQGEVLQSLFRCVEDRGYSREHILKAIRTYDEDALWNFLGPILDEIEEHVNATI